MEYEWSKYGIKNLTSVAVYQPSIQTENRLTTLIHAKFPQARILKIEQVNNKYLSEAFDLKSLEIRLRYRNTFEIEELLHATSNANVESILENNLNWRLVKRAKYGKGVSFSSNASYANKYCNNRNGNSRAFVICDVIVGKKHYVYDNVHVIPRANADTYCSKNGMVYVKFDDFTFNPKFVVYYQWSEIGSGSPLVSDGLVPLTARTRELMERVEKEMRRKQNEERIQPSNVTRQIPAQSTNFINQGQRPTLRNTQREPFQANCSTYSSSANRRYTVHDQSQPVYSTYRRQPSQNSNDSCMIL